MPLLLGIDVGTSAVKAVVCDMRGRVIASAFSAHEPSRPHPGWSEQDSEDWWRSSCRAIRAVLGAGPRVRADRIAAVGLSGQLHGAVILGEDAADRSGKARELRPTIMWNDQRSGSQCEMIERTFGGRAGIVRLAGNAALAGFVLPKLLWVREHEPRVWKRARHIMLPKDFVRLRLTGALATDVGDASGTLLFDVVNRRWSSQIPSRVGIDPAMFPPAHESTEITGHVSAWAARLTGLPVNTPVVSGSGDNQCGAVGAGVVEPGIAMAMLGTSGVILAHSRRPRLDLPKPPALPGRLHAMCAATGSRASPTGWTITGVMLSAAGSLAWCRDTIAPDVPYSTLLREAASAPPGCDGLLFMPQLSGERCPYPDPLARGGWIGLTARHTRAHLVRAVVEGVTFTMGHMLDMVRGAGVEVSRVHLSGGGNQSAFWRQLQADIYGCPVGTTSTDRGGTAFGAAVLAGVGIGVWASVAEACRKSVRLQRQLAPSRGARSRYAEYRRVHAALYHDLRPRFVELSSAAAGR
ncbi:MAG: xylulokinase [Phycisphaerales bacterium]|nr:xylulokinase [Phycisphaerales bacterium]